MDQWIEEIRRHVDKKIFPKVLRYKRASKIEMEVLQDCDIVVTSYTDVMKEFPYPDSKEEKIALQKFGYQKWWQNAARRIGVLFQVCESDYLHGLGLIGWAGSLVPCCS